MKIRHQIWNASLVPLHRLKMNRLAQKQLLHTVPASPSFQRMPYRKRELLESLLPRDFETYSSLPFSVGIVSSVQEIDLLPLSTEAILITHTELLAEKIIVAPGQQLKDIRKVVPSEFQCVSDDELLTPELSKLIDRIAPPNRRGWIRQQALKILLAKSLGGNGTLLVDADTILLRKQNWISESGQQNLQISTEYHEPYQLHFESFNQKIHQERGVPRVRLQASFVTHHQLMQPKVLDEIFIRDNHTFHQGLQKWIGAIDFATNESPACEWHTYGTYLALNTPSRIQLTQWKNIGISRNSKSKHHGKALKDMKVSEIIQEFKGHNSISLHHYIPS